MQKRAKFKKGVFWSYKFWKGHDGQIKKTACKNAYLGSIFKPEKYVFRVCFESPFTRIISSPKYKCPPPARRLSFFWVLKRLWNTCMYHVNQIKYPGSNNVIEHALRGYCTPEPYFWRLCAFSQKIKQLRTKYPMDLVRNVQRNSKITVLLQ